MIRLENEKESITFSSNFFSFLVHYLDNKKELLTFMPGSFSMSGRQQTGTGTGTLAPILDDEVESSEVGVEATDPEP